MYKRSFSILASLLLLFTAASCTGNNTNSEDEILTYVESLNSGSSTTVPSNNTRITTEAATTTSFKDPWEAIDAGASGSLSTGDFSADGFEARLDFFEASRVTAALEFLYFNSQQTQVGRGVFLVYPEIDDFEINFIIRLRNKERIKTVLETTPYIPQNLEYYKLEYDYEDEYPYVYRFNAKLWHLEGIPSLDAIKAWAYSWKNKEMPKQFFTLKPEAIQYFKTVGSDSQLPTLDRLKKYQAVFSDEDPYFVDRQRGIKYLFGVNEALFSADKTVVAFPYLRICELFDEADTYCNLYYSYNNSKFTFVPEEWLNDYPDASVSDVLESEIYPGEAIFGYIVMPYSGTGVYTFRGARKDYTKFKIYTGDYDLTSMELSVQDYCYVNDAAVATLDAVLASTSHVCDTRSSAVSRDNWYTTATQKAVINYYRYVQSYTDSNIWVQLASDRHFMWFIQDGILYVYHMRDDSGDSDYILSGDLAWAVLSTSLFSESTSVQQMGGINNFISAYNRTFGTNVALS